MARFPLIRDLRRSVPVQPDPEDADLPQRWDADRKRDDPRWWEEGWQATAAEAKEMTAKLIPIVTTAQTIDAIELAQTSIHRCPVAAKMRLMLSFPRLQPGVRALERAQKPGTDLWQAVLEAHFILAFNERTVDLQNRN